MSGVTRRLVLGASAASAGLVVAGGGAAADDADLDAVEEPTPMIYVRDAKAGAVVFLHEDSETVVTDRQLAAGIAQTQKQAQKKAAKLQRASD
jgi:hypothetical protein